MYVCMYVCMYAHVCTFVVLGQEKTAANVVTDLSHNNRCFQCNIAIMNFHVSHTCEIRFHDVRGQSTVYMYSYANIPKYG